MTIFTGNKVREIQNHSELAKLLKNRSSTQTIYISFSKVHFCHFIYSDKCRKDLSKRNKKLRKLSRKKSRFWPEDPSCFTTVI